MTENLNPWALAAVSLGALLLACLGGCVYYYLRAGRYLAEREEATRCLDALEDDIGRMVDEALAEQSQQYESASREVAALQLAETPGQQLCQSVRDAVRDQFGRMSQEFVGNLGDNAESLVRDLNFELCEKIWDAFQSYKDVCVESPPVWPEGVRVAYTKGSQTVLVIEQKPQVRSLLFDASLLNRKTMGAAAEQVDEECYRFALAFPYVYFVMVFTGGSYRRHELYFRNKPLTSLREHVYLAPIPNVFRQRVDEESHYMCMGRAYSVDGRAPLTVQAAHVISDFWQTRFNNDLGSGGADKVDARIRNYRVWQQHSAADPLFVLGVKWPNGKTLKGVLETLFEHRPMGGVLDHADQHVRQLLEAGVAKIVDKVQQEWQSVRRRELSADALQGAAEDLLKELIVRNVQLTLKKGRTRGD